MIGPLRGADCTNFILEKSPETGATIESSLVRGMIVLGLFFGIWLLVGFVRVELMLSVLSFLFIFFSVGHGSR